MLRFSFHEYVLDTTSTANVSQSSMLQDLGSPRSANFLLWILRMALDFTYGSLKKKSRLLKNV